MANNYQDGTGSFVFEGEPKLSPVSTILMNHITQYQDGEGFYLEEGAYISISDLAVSLIDYAIDCVKDDASKKRLMLKLDKAKKDCVECKHTAFQKLPGLIRRAGVSINNMLEQAIQNESSHPIDFVMSVVDDRDSNLLSVSYEEAYTCSKKRLGEFGGVGYFYSRNVSHLASSHEVVSYGAELEQAILIQDMPTIRNVVSRQITMVVNAIRNPSIQAQVAKALLCGEALDMVEDGITNNCDDNDDDERRTISKNMGEKLFNEILIHVETIAGIAEQYGQQTLVDLIYLLHVLTANRQGGKGFIEQTFGSRIAEFLKTLPNGADYLKFVSTAMCDEPSVQAGAK